MERKEEEEFTSVSQHLLGERRTAEKKTEDCTMIMSA